MHYRIIHADKRWKRVENHLDGRECPICHVTVHGHQAQRDHLERHKDDIRLREIVDQLAARAGILLHPDDQAAPDNWPAEFERDDQEAASG
jgi:hypothetical protein